MRKLGGSSRWPERLLLSLVLLVAFSFGVVARASAEVNLTGLVAERLRIAAVGEASEAALAQARSTPASTVRTVYCFPEEDIVARVQLVGLVPSPESLESLVALTWVEYKPPGAWFATWRLVLEGQREFLPQEQLRPGAGPLKNSHFIHLLSTSPEPGHEYESLLSYDAALGILSIRLTDKTTGALVYAGGWQVAPRTQEYVPSVTVTYKEEKHRGRLEGDLSGMKTTPVYVPVDLRMQIVQKEQGGFFSVSRLDRQQPGGLLVQTEAPAGGDLHVLMSRADEKPRRIYSCRVENQVFVPFPLAGLPAGRYQLAVQYVGEDGGVRFEARGIVPVGYIRAFWSEVQADKEKGLLTGFLNVSADGDVEPVQVTISACAEQDGRDGTKRLLDEQQIVQTRLPLSIEPQLIPFSIVLPAAESSALLKVTAQAGIEAPADMALGDVPPLKRRLYIGPALRQAFQPYFLVGAALDRFAPDTEDLVAYHFSSITTENVLKWSSVHPSSETYDFGPADRLLRFAEKHDMVAIGHTLIWHQQTPSWVFVDEDGRPASPELLLRRMEEHIKDVVGHFRGRVRGWDVVNEAIADGGTADLRSTPWLEGIGEDYIALAFKWAHEADPDVELYYNDYNLWDPLKRERTYRLVKRLLEQGIRVDAIGMQGHYSLDHPPVHLIRESIERFASLGVRVNITELDVSVYSWQDRQDRYQAGLPEHVAERQAARYRELFELFTEYSEVIDRVTFWGTTDRHSWLNNYPVRGRRNYPLLFDRDGRFKSAYWAVMEVAGGGPSE